MSEIDLQRQIDALLRRVKDMEAGENAPIACRVYNDAAFTHNSSGNNLAVTFNSERWDTYAMHSTSTNTSRITVPIGGWYLIVGSVSWDNNNTGSRSIGIMVDGTTTIVSNRTNNLGASTVDLNMSVSTLYYLAATSYVELIAWQNSGGSLDIVANANYSPELAVMRLP